MRPQSERVIGDGNPQAERTIRTAGFGRLQQQPGGAGAIRYARLSGRKSKPNGQGSRKASAAHAPRSMTLPGPHTRDASHGPPVAATRTGCAFTRAPIWGWQRATDLARAMRPDPLSALPGAQTEVNTRDVRYPARLRGLASAAPKYFSCQLPVASRQLSVFHPNSFSAIMLQRRTPLFTGCFLAPDFSALRFSTGFHK